MKTCPYCGAKYPDEAVVCAIDQTPFEQPIEPPRSESTQPEPRRPEYEFAPLSTADEQQNLVTLVTCGTLVAADMIVTRLRAAGINTFMPDERLMQAIGWNFNTFGYVRVQVSPTDYAAARELLTEPDASMNHE